MKNATIKQAIELGFDFENSDFETKEEMEQKILTFFFENDNLLPRKTDECPIDQHGRHQSVSYFNVNFGIDYRSDGEITNYSHVNPFGKMKRFYHSSVVGIDTKTGKAYRFDLYEMNKML